MNNVYISPGVYIREIDKTRSSNIRASSLGITDDGSTSEMTSGDTYLRSIAYTDVSCMWDEDDNKMVLNFYNMNGEKMSVIYLFDTDSDGDILFDAGNF